MKRCVRVSDHLDKEKFVKGKMSDSQWRVYEKKYIATRPKKLKLRNECLLVFSLIALWDIFIIYARYFLENLTFHSIYFSNKLWTNCNRVTQFHVIVTTITDHSLSGKFWMIQLWVSAQFVDSGAKDCVFSLTRWKWKCHHLTLVPGRKNINIAVDI